MASLSGVQIWLIRQWTAANLKARREYYANPITTAHRPVTWAVCSGGCGNEILVDFARGKGTCRRCRDRKRKRARRSAAEAQ